MFKNAGVNIRITNGAGGRAVEGYVSHQSILAGEKLKVFVSTNPEQAYKIDIYRLGYYGGKGGRKMRSSGTLMGIRQAEPQPDSVTNLFEAGWKESWAFTIPAGLAERGITSGRSRQSRTVPRPT
jgi:hypothetical protein